MFRVGNVDEYSGLQVPMSIQETIQPTNVIGGYIVNATDLVASCNEGEDDKFDSLKDYASSNSNA
jgi:hypothetical protein